MIQYVSRVICPGFLLHFFYIYVIITRDQNTQNGQKKEQFFCPGDPRGFFVGRLLAIAPFLQGAYHRGWIADHTINLCAELALHRADGLWSDVSVSSYPRPFLDGLDQS